MHQADFDGEMHRKQMRETRNGMVLDLSILVVCASVAATIIYYVAPIMARIMEARS
jgi:phosphatidylglycerophosphate synthase